MSNLAYSTNSAGETRSNLARLAGDVAFDAPANIRRPVTAKHKPRTKAPAFDPALVSKTLSPKA